MIVHFFVLAPECVTVTATISGSEPQAQEVSALSQMVDVIDVLQLDAGQLVVCRESLVLTGSGVDDAGSFDVATKTERRAARLLAVTRATSATLAVSEA